MKKFDFQITTETCKPSQGYTCKIYILQDKALKPVPKPAPVSGDLGEWTEHTDLDMAYQGDVEQIHDWKNYYSIDQLKQIALEKGYTCFTVSDSSFGFAAMKKFDFQVTPETCKPPEGYSCKFYIHQRKDLAPAPKGNYDGDLNDTARNTNDVAKIRELVKKGANLLSTNGEPWNHTPLHQASYHNRPKIIEVLVELLNEKGQLDECLSKHSNPCGRGEHGTPIELARGGGHSECVALLDAARSLKK